MVGLQRLLSMSKKVQTNQNIKRSLKKETNSVNSNGSKNLLLASSSDMCSQDMVKDYKLYKIQEINPKDRVKLEIANNGRGGAKLQYFDSNMLSQFQLQKIDDMILSKDEKMLYMVTFLGKKDPTIERRCICTSEDMAIIQVRSHRKYRSQYLEQFLINNIH